MDECSGKVLLSGFEIDEVEKVIVNNMLKNYEQKVLERSPFDYLKLRLRKSQKAKTLLYQIEGELKIKSKKFSAKAQDYSLFSVLSDVLERLYNEMTHTLRTARQ